MVTGARFAGSVRASIAFLLTFGALDLDLFETYRVLFTELLGPMASVASRICPKFVPEKVL